MYNGNSFVLNITKEFFELLQKHPNDFSIKSFNVSGVRLEFFKKYRKFLEKVIKQYSFVDPFAGEFKFEEFEEDEEQGEEEEFDFYSALDGGSEWTS